MPELKSTVPVGRSAMIAAARLLGYLLFSLVSLSEVPRAEADSAPVRVGIVSYQDAADPISEYDTILRTASASSRIALQSAFGTYGELQQWLDRGEVDLALVTPGLFAELLESERSLWTYVSTETSESPHSVCSVRADRALRSAADLKVADERGSLRVAFADPRSVSGRIAPEFALREEGISVEHGDRWFAQSHSVALSWAVEEDAATERIACVSAEAFQSFSGKERLRKLDLPKLEAMVIPGDVLIVRRGAADAAKLGAAIVAAAPERFRTEPQWEPAYRRITAWRKALSRPDEGSLDNFLTLSELGANLEHMIRSGSRRPRIAVVFPGGGAKCSYQVGAMRAIEEELARVRSATGQGDVDIEVIVGTSGGAINSIPAALAITASAEGYRQLSAIWEELDRRDIVRPSFAVRANMALWFAATQLWLIFSLAPRGRGRISAFALGLAETLLAWLSFDPWTLLGPTGGLHLGWMYLSWGWAGGGPLLLLSSLAVRRYSNGVRIALLSLVLGLPAIQTVTILCIESTFSSSAGIEAVVAEKFPRLINAELERRNEKPLRLGTGGSTQERLARMSAELIERRLFPRSLVITASPLVDPENPLPGDLYFHLSGRNDSMEPTFRERSMPLSDRRELLFDAMIGSGSIFPIFPPHVIENFPYPGHHAELVDGSFAHRSPIEAAVRWGATDIIVLDPSTTEITTRGSFASNMAAALAHLYDQAQLVDLQSKREVNVFTLNPTPPQIGLLDFSGNLIRSSVAKGYDEARNRGLFRKEVGAPRFTALESEPKSQPDTGGR